MSDCLILFKTIILISLYESNILDKQQIFKNQISKNFVSGIPDGFTDASDPSGHLSRWVDVVRLHVLSEALLRGQVELHHGVGEGVGVASQRRDHSQHCAAESAVNLCKTT